MTIHEALQTGTRILQDSAIADPGWNSERLLMHAAGLSRPQLYSRLQQEIQRETADLFLELVTKRSRHFPLAYIEGNQEFFGRTFEVNPSVLIPRPETEDIVRAILELGFAPSRILDLGAGSGAIAVTLAREIPSASVIALEISGDSISVIRKNAPHGNVAIVRADFLKTPFCSAVFDAVVSNPPYVERQDVLPEETKWEPEAALCVENLEELYEALIRESARLLRDRGVFVFEIGHGQDSRIRKLCSENSGFEVEQVRNDPAGIPRVFVLRRQPRR